MKTNLPSGLNYRTFPLTLSPSAFFYLVLQGVVTDGRAGGMILGRGYSEGGIYVIHQRGNDFLIHSCVEGGEFVLNKDASCKNLRRLTAMNNGHTAHEAADERSNVRLAQFIITNAQPDDKLLWLNWNQVVVAAAPADKHIAELVKMNEHENPYAFCDHEDLFPPEEPRTADGII